MKDDTGLGAALLQLCEGARRCDPTDTADSWLMGDGIPLRNAAVGALMAHPEIAPHLQRGQFLHVPLGAGSGLESPENLLRPLLREVLARPSNEWESEIQRFIELLRMSDGQAPCTVQAGLSGIQLQHSPLQLEDGAIRGTAASDFFETDPADASIRVVFEYRTSIPAAIREIGFDFAAQTVAEVEAEHRLRATRLLIALALETSAPVQEQMVRRQIDFSSAGGGLQPRHLGQIAASRPSMIDPSTANRVAATYGQLGNADLAALGVAVRRFLLARTERVRPDDQVIDYAIALESMTSLHGGENQGEELAQLLATEDHDSGSIEDMHERFREARRSIVHDGDVPLHSEAAAASGRFLVEQSLRVRTHLSAQPHTPG